MSVTGSVRVGVVVTLGCCLIGVGCGEQQEAQRYEVEVFADGTKLEPVQTDRGYEVEVDSVAMAVQQFEFTVGGQTHDGGEASLLQTVEGWFVSEAAAHPNHAAGGETGGVFAGPMLVEWTAGEIEPLGGGEFLQGEYAGYDVTFADDGVDLEEGIIGRVEGVATDAGGAEFSFGVDIEYGTGASVVGGALSATIPDDDMEGIGLQLLSSDEWSEQSLFDGVNFSDHLDAEEEHAELDLESNDAARVRSAVVAHEFYAGEVVHSQQM